MWVLLLFFIGIVVNLCGMDLSIVEQKYVSKHPNALKGFLCMSFSRTRSLTLNLSDTQKNEVRKKIIDDKDEYGTLLFNIATQFPHEVQKIIVSKLLNNNEIPAQRFITNPLIQELDRYCFSCDVMDGKELGHFRASVTKADNLRGVCEIDFVYELLDEIKIVDEFRLTNGASARQLKAISTVFGQNDSTVRYFFRKSYTLSNFVKTISEPQAIAFVILSLPILSALIEKKFCSKTFLVQKIYDENRRNAISNIAFKAEFEKTGDEFWLQRYKMQDPFAYSQRDWIKMGLPYFLLGPGVVIIVENYRKGEFVETLKLLFSVPGIFASLIYGIAHIVLSELLFYGLSRISPLFEDQVMVRGGILGLYVLGCSLYNIRQMRKAEKGSIAIKYISALLQREDIEIE